MSIKALRSLVLICYFGLLILLASWFTVLAPPNEKLISLSILLLIGPLLLPLRGLLHDRLYTHKWTIFLTFIYFIHGVMEAYANVDARILGITEVILSTGLFASLIFYIRAKRDT